uniref:DNA repair and recombination protein RAD54-like n=1 Tax=Panagrolaimus superbus TaxID=310955 RepID=A0A914YF19_9BILA
MVKLLESTLHNKEAALNNASDPTTSHHAQSNKKTFMVCYDKASGRKNKLYRYDGFFEVINGNYGRFLDEGRQLLAQDHLDKHTVEEIEDFGPFVFDNYDIESHEEIKSIYSAREAIVEPPLKTFSDFQKVEPRTMQKPVNYQIKETFPKSFKEGAPIFRSLVKNVSSIAKPEQIHHDAYIIQEPNERYPNGVKIAPILAKVMRDHQKEGVKFLFNALHKGDNGAILADDMGLGKTLQSIALIHTMVNTKLANKYKLINRVLLICPLSLRQNWLDEFEKWGIRNFCYIPSNKDEVERYIAISSRTPVCILNYNIVASYGKILNMSKFDLMICDEGHVLKNTTKIRKTLLDLPSQRRVILTGTPIQNTLKEFYQLTTFVHPTRFESLEDFAQQIQEKKSDAFSSFFLRRTAEVNQKFLPPRHDFLVFCQPSPLQIEVYGKALDVITANTFSMFNAFRQICNHPALLYKNVRTPEYIDFARCFNVYPIDYDSVNLKCEESGKLATLAAMVVNFRNESDKTVIVSQSTQCLSLIGQLVKALQFKIYRLDGKTAPEKRQKLVTHFNGSDDPNDIFLLSTNAGGVGLNLIGANRLIMFDCSWNPASDFQAMGRTWREGQKKKVYIYRLFTAGTVEEKFLQLQIKKTGLATIVNPWAAWKNKNKDIDLDELKNYDEFAPGVACDTHDSIKCDCEGNGNTERDEDDDWYDNDDVDMDCDDDGTGAEEDHEGMDEDLDDFHVNQDKSNVYARISLDQLYKWHHHAHGSKSFNKILDACGLFDDTPVSFIMETEFIPPGSNNDAVEEDSASFQDVTEEYQDSTQSAVEEYDTPIVSQSDKVLTSVDDEENSDQLGDMFVDENPEVAYNNTNEIDNEHILTPLMAKHNESTAEDFNTTAEIQNVTTSQSDYTLTNYLIF